MVNPFTQSPPLCINPSRVHPPYIQYPPQVISLLESMNLGRYKEQFIKEQVDGEILSECDEVMLKNDLKVSSAMHRTRLMKVITGRHSALGFIEGDSLYSTLDRT